MMVPFNRIHLIRTFLGFCIMSTISLYVYTWFLNQNLGTYIPSSQPKIYSSISNSSASIPHKDKDDEVEEEEEEEEILCKIPELDPHNKGMVKLIQDEFESKWGKAPPCVNNSATKFEIDLDSNLVRIYRNDSTKNAKFWSQATTCYFQKYMRDPEAPDFTFVYDEITPILNNLTHLDGEYEFVSVWCYNNKSEGDNNFKIKSNDNLIYEDHLIHIPVKKKFSSPSSKSSSLSGAQKMSIIILGMDMLSRSNFVRSMPKSYKFLKDRMQAAEFTSFNSLGWVTWESVIPLLTGYRPTDLRHEHCLWLDYLKTWPLDSCPFIWKFLSKSGYATSYSDEDRRGIRPFLKSPSLDYDFRDFVVTKRTETIIGHDDQINGNGWESGYNRMCMGSRLTYSVHLDIIRRMAHRFQRGHHHDQHPYFHFSWTNLLTNSLEVIAYSRFADEPLYKLLDQLTKEKLLQNTALILMGDHGLRDGAARTTTSQGFFEERLPLLMIALPSTFKTKYPAAMKNFLKNQNRLVTAFDVHATLHDFADLTRLTNDQIEARGPRRQNDQQEKISSSLFLPVSSRRSCETFFSNSPSFCACLPLLSSDAGLADVNSANVQFMAMRLVDEVNERLAIYQKVCRPWSLKKVIQVTIFKNHIETYSRPEYLIEELLFIKPVPREYRDLYQIQLETTLGLQYSAYLTIKEQNGIGHDSVEVLEVSRVFRSTNSTVLKKWVKECPGLTNVKKDVRRVCQCI